LIAVETVEGGVAFKCRPHRVQTEREDKNKIKGLIKSQCEHVQYSRCRAAFNVV